MPSSRSDSVHETGRDRGPRRCRNNCFFCYVKGLPAGLRKSLYIRDDDLLQSFVYGSFVTLTNLSERDWCLLEQRRLSPLRVSIHATDLDLRRRMLGNPQAPNILDQLQRLGKLGIRVHAQVVLCPGVNDGAAMEKTVRDLAAMDPVVESLALVPVGLSLPLEENIQRRPAPWPVARFNAEQSRRIIEWAEPRQEEFRRTLGKTFLQLADEFYLLAGRPIPAAAQYDGFPQYQNGIGAVRTLLDDWEKFERQTRQKIDTGNKPVPRRLIALCGKLIAPVIKDLTRSIVEATGLDVTVVPVENRLFGPRVTVSGLIPGRDYLDAVPSSREGDLVLVPRRAIEASGRYFLDNLSLQCFRRLVRPAAVRTVDRPADLSRALWDSPSKGTMKKQCAA